ncbi:MAG: 16S rRNA (adenine(1518)-N(6)/adenine(1519)-N(6))-dimethyltransferase RsmA [Nitrososphaerota archaeon]|jgi:16S rRNA (adenine1518-N6/adenine1519-N6)-dimethyltransferase|uniref:16S rRNA (adenine(1518)-N(6)/adenine(1519)-N(6))- dimethyltransferase RsmA n=1 Tax=Candidatus Bathycorpusculum sp. TaxID=2994959 RepID=UPI00282F045D|nr:16S rRNA (adenine(1518)-N(6)/adenine(1519)-N(6))-dimethyltransferase RsmA [Candidatus Termitimicrobium sp.]MCL2431383.1 16S rRNA (adenine(1518)-N(6)/adenine(1519)-N(6))-dimethyltransferase RsmA [Candidatus Termitimicrobium sp.]MDR0492065.1 16S rRNA (adenine(1518)-N(6)/adenine(1519)-N(6))-dimethyltransferase RsmA [Nitrososphaerota archaeon]
MSQEQIQHLLLAHHLTPNKLLGQNFMVDPDLYPKLCQYSTLNGSDVVLDVGAGFGFLTRFLSDKCRAVVAVEKDPQIAQVLRKNLKDIENVSIVEGDVLKIPLPEFNKVIAIPPYYLSSQLVMRLLEQRVDCIVMIVQKEFAERLTATVGSEEYSWLTVTAHQQAQAILLDTVPKDKFYPPPEVDSIILCLKPWTEKPFEVKDHTLFVQLTKWLFSERNKKFSKAITPFLRNRLKLSKPDAEKLAKTLPFSERRPRELTPQDFGAIADALPN